MLVSTERRCARPPDRCPPSCLRHLPLEKALRASLAQRNFLLPAVAVHLSQLTIPSVVPDFADWLIRNVAQNFLSAVIQAAQRDVAIYEHRKCPPQPVAGLADPLLG